MNRLIIAAFAVLLTLACSFVSNILNPTPTPVDAEPVSYSDCPGSQPTQDEINFTLHYKDEYFSPSDWKSNYTVMDDWVLVTWDNQKLAAMANFNYAIVCGVENASLDKYYTKQTFDQIFDYYDGYEIQKACELDGVRLYEIKTRAKGVDFHAKLWVEVLDKDHLMESQLLFPTSAAADLEAYSKKIMPKFPSCE